MDWHAWLVDINHTPEWEAQDLELKSEYFINLNTPCMFSVSLNKWHSVLPLLWTQCVSPIFHVTPSFPFVSLYDMQSQNRKGKSPLTEQSLRVYNICINRIVLSCSFWVVHDETRRRKKVDEQKNWNFYVWFFPPWEKLVELWSRFSNKIAKGCSL